MRNTANRGRRASRAKEFNQQRAEGPTLVPQALNGKWVQLRLSEATHTISISVSIKETPQRDEREEEGEKNEGWEEEEERKSNSHQMTRQPSPPLKLSLNAELKKVSQI